MERVRFFTGNSLIFSLGYTIQICRENTAFLKELFLFLTFGMRDKIPVALIEPHRNVVDFLCYFIGRKSRLFCSFQQFISNHRGDETNGNLGFYPSFTVYSGLAVTKLSFNYRKISFNRASHGVNFIGSSGAHLFGSCKRTESFLIAADLYFFHIYQDCFPAFILLDFHAFFKFLRNFGIFS